MQVDALCNSGDSWGRIQESSTQHGARAVGNNGRKQGRTTVTGARAMARTIAEAKMSESKICGKDKGQGNVWKSDNGRRGNWRGL